MFLPLFFLLFGPLARMENEGLANSVLLGIQLNERTTAAESYFGISWDLVNAVGLEIKNGISIIKKKFFMLSWWNNRRTRATK